MFGSGWIKLYRKTLDSRVFQNAELLRLWLYLLLRASYQPQWFSISTGRGKTEVHLVEGQLIVGRKKLAEALNLKESTVWKQLKKLESLGNITIDSNSHYSIVTICNWEKYQDNNNGIVTTTEQPNNSNVAAEEQRSDTNNNNNNSNNQNNLKKNKKKREIRVDFEIPSLSDVADYIFEENLDINAEDFFYLNDGNEWKINGEPIRDWRAALRGFVQKKEDSEKMKMLMKGVNMNLLQKLNDVSVGEFIESDSDEFTWEKKTETEYYNITKGYISDIDFAKQYNGFSVIED